MRLNASDSAREGSNQMQVDESTSSTSETDDLSKINVGCNTIQGRLDIVDALVKESEIRCSIRDSHLKNVKVTLDLPKSFVGFNYAVSPSSFSSS